MSTYQAAKAAVKAGKVGSIRARQSEKGVLNRPLDVSVSPAHDLYLH